MKKLILAAVMAVFAASAHAEATAADWNSYAALKSAAHADLIVLESNSYQGLTSTPADECVALAKMGIEPLERKEITAWGWNNAGYAYILQFKNTLNWVKTFADIKEMPVSTKEERQAKLDKVRGMQKSASDNFYLLSLSGAMLGNAEKTKFQNDDFQNKLSSNRQFIQWVNHFIHTDYK